MRFTTTITFLNFSLKTKHPEIKLKNIALKNIEHIDAALSLIEILTFHLIMTNLEIMQFEISALKWWKKAITDIIT